MRAFRYLHFATPGLLDDQHPMRSALILVQDRPPGPPGAVRKGPAASEGRLTAERILRGWKLDAELVTLSACQTALGQEGGGEGYLGFSQALFLAGARSVVLSLWEVDDRASALLMVRFYQNWLGKRPGLDRPLPKWLRPDRVGAVLEVNTHYNVIVHCKPGSRAWEKEPLHSLLMGMLKPPRTWVLIQTGEQTFALLKNGSVARMRDIGVDPASQENMYVLAEPEPLTFANLTTKSLVREIGFISASCGR